MKSTILKYGIYAAVTIVGLFAAETIIWGMTLDYKTSEALGYLSMFISLSFIYFGVKAYRDEEAGGSISFVQALKVGALIALLPAAAFFLYNVGFFTLYGEQFAEYSLQSMSAEQRAQLEANKELFMNPFFQGLVMFLTVYVIGFALSLLSAMVLQRVKEA